MNIKGSKDLHDIEIKVRLNKRQSEKLDQLAALTDIPRAVIIRTLFERAMEQGAKHYLFDDRPTARTFEGPQRACRGRDGE